jgi:biotin carboxyl carrier protein
MQYAVEVNGRVRQVVVRRQDGKWVVDVDGRVWTVDAVPAGGHALSLLVTETTEAGLKAGTTASATEVRLNADATTSPGVASGLSRTPKDGAVSGFGRTLSHEVTLAGDAVTGLMNVHIGPSVVPVALNGRRRSGRNEDGAQSGSGPQRLLAPMPGKVVRVLVKKGDPVRARQPIAVIEAMKMENELRSGRDGVIAELPVTGGQSVEAGTLIAVVKSANTANDASHSR